MLTLTVLRVSLNKLLSPTCGAGMFLDLLGLGLVVLRAGNSSLATLFLLASSSFVIQLFCSSILAFSSYIISSNLSNLSFEAFDSYSLAVFMVVSLFVFLDCRIRCVIPAFIVSNPLLMA